MTGLCGVLEHLRAPILVDHAQVLQIQLLNHQDGESVVAVL